MKEKKMTTKDFVNEINTIPGKHNWYYIHKKTHRAGVLPLLAAKILETKGGKDKLSVSYEAPAGFSLMDYVIYPTEAEWINDIKSGTTTQRPLP